jgi:hypothetical protein
MIKAIYKFLSPKYQNLFLEYKVNFKPRYGYGNQVHQQLLSIINQNRNNYRDFLNEALELKEQIWTIKDYSQENDPIEPTWNNGFLPGLDIVGIYTMLNHYKPNKYVEIGSGNSTKVTYKAKKAQNLITEIISIDPKPRAEIDNLSDKIIRQPFENTELDIVELLDENDILFIDNSHRILPNSDSMVFFLEILPRLKKGVIVHIHDIYLPYDYPQFMCDRFYSEQYGLAMYLLANPEKYQTLLPNYFIHNDKELSNLISPVWDHENLKNVEKHGGSFWLRIND